MASRGRQTRARDSGGARARISASYGGGINYEFADDLMSAPAECKDLTPIWPYMIQRIRDMINEAFLSLGTSVGRKWTKLNKSYNKRKTQQPKQFKKINPKAGKRRTVYPDTQMIRTGKLYNSLMKDSAIIKKTYSNLVYGIKSSIVKYAKPLAVGGKRGNSNYLQGRRYLGVPEWLKIDFINSVRKQVESAMNDQFRPEYNIELGGKK